MPFSTLEKQFDLLTTERQKTVYSFVNYLLSEQENEAKTMPSTVSEKISLLDSLVGIVPSNVNLDKERTERISRYRRYKKNNGRNGLFCWNG